MVEGGDPRSWIVRLRQHGGLDGWIKEMERPQTPKLLQQDTVG